jgi:hypothetical protein
MDVKTKEEDFSQITDNLKIELPTNENEDKKKEKMKLKNH